MHLVEPLPTEGEPAENYLTVREELREHGAGLEQLPELVVLSKADLLPAEETERVVAEWAAGADGTPGAQVESGAPGEAGAPGPIAVSAATGAGLDELRRAIAALLADAPARATPTTPSTPTTPATEEPPLAEHRLYRPAGEEGYSIRREDGAYRVVGRGIELLFERHDLKNEEALAYLEQRLAELGVIAALRAAGFETGDEVRVGEHELELHTSDT